MELRELKCKNCGANLEVEADKKEVYCKFCNTKFAVESAENTAYEEEKGRIRAQREEMENNIKAVSEMQAELQKQQWKRTPLFMKILIFGIFAVAIIICIYVFAKVLLNMS